MSKDMLIKSVAFNTNDPDQLSLIDHASKRTNFSAYVKRLIQRDMDGSVHIVSDPVPAAFEEKEDFSADGWT